MSLLLAVGRWRAALSSQFCVLVISEHTRFTRSAAAVCEAAPQHRDAPPLCRGQFHHLPKTADPSALGVQACPFPRCSVVQWRGDASGLFEFAARVSMTQRGARNRENECPPVATASASFSFQCFAILSARGSSGLGALSRAWILCRGAGQIPFSRVVTSRFTARVGIGRGNAEQLA